MNSDSLADKKAVPLPDRGTRLDRWVAANWPELSRARVQELLEEGLILVNGAPVQVEARQRPPLRAEPEAIPLQIVFEDDDLLIVNKPAGMSVHAGAGNS